MEADDARRRQLLSFVIVGGGPTGVELAGSIAELSQRALASDFRHIRPESAQIVLIEAGPRILASFPESLSRHAQKDLERLGVRVRTGARVTRVSDEGVWVGESFLASKTVIWAAGVVASPVGQWLDLQTDSQGRVRVSADLSVPGHPDIFVIGDAAQPLPAVAPVAMQQGRYVASVILKRLRGERETKPFRYRDKGNLATIGRSSAVAEIGRLRLSGFIAWVTWLFVHIFYLIGFRNRVLVLIQWAWSYLTFQRGARLITGEKTK
jgi:NADH dehydrogenase